MWRGESFRGANRQCVYRMNDLASQVTAPYSYNFPRGWKIYVASSPETCPPRRTRGNDDRHFAAGDIQLCARSGTAAIGGSGVYFPEVWRAGRSARRSSSPAIRASLQSALDAKRASIQPIESVAAEDIGKMPDQNVSESLQRFPGISINRSGGKGTQVLIDGLANNLITLNGEVLLTGREIYSSGEGSGGAGGIQYASLEGIPSEEIGGIDVIKNPTARDREGGLGGQIDLKTRSPLAQQHGPEPGWQPRGTKAAVRMVASLQWPRSWVASSSTTALPSPPAPPTTMRRLTTNSSRTRTATSG